MFEKEAKEYTKNIFCNVNCSIGHPRARSVNLLDVEQAFQDGAEFAYNKANEWHYVKDGDLPKENKKYWILTSNREPKVDSWLTISWVNFYDVIAWKEIVLPELKENIKI